MTLYHKIKNTISDFWYDFRARCQRFKRGYSYGDVWDMDFWFMRTVKPMLIHLRDHGTGIPNELYVNGENERIHWENILTEMINCLDMMDEDIVRKKLRLNYGTSLSCEDYKLICDTMDKSKKRFFELFSYYFYHLYD